MKKVVVFIAFLLLGCESRIKKDLRDSTQQMNTAGANLPEPKFNKELEALLTEYKEKYQAKGVRIGRSFIYSSDGDSSYWLKVEFLNPELDSKAFKDFGNEVAMNTFQHLTNDQDFEKIEVSVTQKKGFIITFSSSQNAFFYRDSLQ